MKRIFLALSIVLFTIFLGACTIESVDEYEKASKERIMEENKESIAKEAPAKETESEQKKDTEQSQQTSETPLAKTEQQEDRKTGVAKEQQKEKEVPTTPKPNTQPPNQPNPKPQPPQPKKKTVTISIDAKTLLQHWDMLEPALQSEKYVPKDGIILPETTYELAHDKVTVWDILLQATREHKIQMEHQDAKASIYDSVYVEGINHLYEFSAGELSGWMFSVNGNFASYGSSKYILQDGDKIQWSYTVDLGKDLGQKVDGS